MLNDEVISEHYPAMREGASLSFEAEAISIRGEHAFFRIFADCVSYIEGDPVYLVLYLDTTEAIEQRNRAEKTALELRDLAFVDPVTGGRNRTSFEADAGAAIQAAPPNSYALVAIDIDKFKVVNDQFGLAQGDAVLKTLYEQLSGCIGEGEFAGRISADVFNLLIRAESNDRLEARIESMVADANRHMVIDTAHAYLLTVTAGVYLIDEPDLPMMQIQDRANVARKKAGDKRVNKLCLFHYYSNDDRIKLAKDKDIESRMHTALANREFVAYLQPKLDLQTNTVAGAEALVRWNDPENGLIPPNDFIPLFERNGFIVELDLYMFEQTCSLLKSWHDDGKRAIPISVNLSRMHLRDPHFLDSFEAIRQRYAVPASLIEFELTETLVFENPQMLSGVIDDIHAAGYTCSMDDFGSGYSSLNVLKNLTVDTLKLDRVFFDEPNMEDSRGADIVGIAIELAKRLGMKTVAEGVETERQRAFLAEAGCDMIQGYLYSRPAPLEEFEKLAFGTA
ncbi:putative bifunctional diguanylate cyclase/phosphodiesterase [Raoultibacter phocaeensis]|uniref:putative bifunctional diguanylate cyclase/phosphodiesterase n=1 Tax=Raoultibacter phocaeensis TaxID=2479841 RepID=UPI001C58DDF5|nr:bifunctional diguanylate cyclase/phosphodiesterase [Raoultibacter phocaeensis]